MTVFEELPSGIRTRTTITTALESQVWEQLLVNHLQLDRLSERCPDMFLNPRLSMESGVLQGLDWDREEVKVLTDCMRSNNPELSRLVMSRILKMETWKFDSAKACRMFLNEIEAIYSPLQREIRKLYLEISVWDEQEIKASFELLNSMGRRTANPILPNLASLSVNFSTLRLGPGCNDLYADQRRLKLYGAFSPDFLHIAYALANIQVDVATIEGLQDHEMEKRLRKCMMTGEKLYLRFDTRKDRVGAAAAFEPAEEEEW